MLEVYEYQSRVSMFGNEWKTSSYHSDQLSDARLLSDLNAFANLLETRSSHDGTMYDKRLLTRGEWQCVIRESEGETDSDGWQYASKMERFQASDRQIKTIAEMGSKYRRRQWKMRLILTHVGLSVSVS